jgi:hypothetical protein
VSEAQKFLEALKTEAQLRVNSLKSRICGCDCGCQEENL